MSRDPRWNGTAVDAANWTLVSAVTSSRRLQFMAMRATTRSSRPNRSGAEACSGIVIDAGATTGSSVQAGAHSTTLIAIDSTRATVTSDSVSLPLLASQLLASASMPALPARAPWRRAGLGAFCACAGSGPESGVGRAEPSSIVSTATPAARRRRPWRPRAFRRRLRACRLRSAARRRSRRLFRLYLNGSPHELASAASLGLVCVPCQAAARRLALHQCRRRRFMRRISLLHGRWEDIPGDLARQSSGCAVLGTSSRARSDPLSAACGRCSAPPRCGARIPGLDRIRTSRIFPGGSRPLRLPAISLPRGYAWSVAAEGEPSPVVPGTAIVHSPR